MTELKEQDDDSIQDVNENEDIELGQYFSEEDNTSSQDIQETEDNLSCENIAKEERYCSGHEQLSKEIRKKRNL